MNLVGANVMISFLKDSLHIPRTIFYMFGALDDGRGHEVRLPEA
jgi:hypothetical protein